MPHSAEPIFHTECLNYHDPDVNPGWLVPDLVAAVHNSAVYFSPPPPIKLLQAPEKP